jgi:hypothetical protein
MSWEQHCRRRGPAFKTHQKAHDGVLANEAWFGDGAPVIGKQFTAAKARDRKATIIDILYASAKREREKGNTKLAERLEVLADELFVCCPRWRCGSLACTECGRAFQKAKVIAQTTAIERLTKDRPGKSLVMVTVVPLSITCTVEQLVSLDVQKLNRRLKDALTRAGFKQVMLGSMDFSWEADRGLYQPHWHIAMWTSNRKRLTDRLKAIFPGRERHDRPVMVSETYSLEFLPYSNKAIKLPLLLRTNRRALPYLLLALDRTDPLELMVLSGIRVSAQDGGLEFKKIPRR